MKSTSDSLSPVLPLPSLAPAEAVLKLRELDTPTVPPVEAKSAKRFYAPELDSLRFAAFFGVFIFHAFRALPYDGLSPRVGSIITAASGAGAFGVDLFFALSAYLITEILLREKALTGKLNVHAFYVRRILRIWPLYFFFLGLASLLPLIDHGEQFGWKYVLGFTLLSGNWMIVLFGVPTSVANILWSVSIEEQFYLLWPPLVNKLSRRGMAAIAASLLIISNLTRLFLYHSHAANETVWFNTFARTDPIVLGILLALLPTTRRIVLTGFGRLMLLGAAVTAVLAVSTFGDLNANTQAISAFGLIAYPTVALSCLGILLATLGTVMRLARNATLIYLGKISYGLYVYHLFGLWLAKRLFSGLYGFSYFTICICAALMITLSCASLSYHFLELPFLRLKRRFTYIPSRPV